MSTRSNETHDTIVTLTPIQDRKQEILEGYREHRETQKRIIPTPERPQIEQPDERGLFGIPRRSAQQKRHQERMFGIYYAQRQAAYTIDNAMMLEYYGLRSAIWTVDAEQKEYELTEPGSLAEEVGKQLLIQSAERIQVLEGEVQEEFRRKALGS